MPEGADCTESLIPCTKLYGWMFKSLHYEKFYIVYSKVMSVFLAAWSSGVQYKHS